MLRSFKEISLVAAGGSVNLWGGESCPLSPSGRAILIHESVHITEVVKDVEGLPSDGYGCKGV